MDNVCGLDYMSIQFEILQVSVFLCTIAIWLLWDASTHTPDISTWTPPISTQRRLATHCVLFTDSLYTLSIINTGTYANNGQGISFSSSLLQRHIIYWWITLARYWHIRIMLVSHAKFIIGTACHLNKHRCHYNLYSKQLLLPRLSCATSHRILHYSNLAFTELGRLHL